MPSLFRIALWRRHDALAVDHAGIEEYEIVVDYCAAVEAVDETGATASAVIGSSCAAAVPAAASAAAVSKTITAYAEAAIRIAFTCLILLAAAATGVTNSAKAFQTACSTAMRTITGTGTAAGNHNTVFQNCNIIPCTKHQ